MKTTLISLFLALTFSAQAMAGVFDEFTYAVTVEWDQKDSSFFDEQVTLLEAKLSRLQEAGVTNEELMTLGLSEVKDAKLQAEAKELLNLVATEDLSESEARDLLLSFQEKSFSRGASWTGNTVVTAGVAVVVVIGVVLVAARVYKSKANVRNN